MWRCQLTNSLTLGLYLKRLVRRATYNNLTPRHTIGSYYYLLRLNCCYKQAHTNMETKVPGNERSREQKFPGTFVLRELNERAQERKFQGTFAPRERKVPGTKVPGNFRSWGPKVLHRDLSFLGTKGLGYEKSVIRKLKTYLFKLNC